MSEPFETAKFRHLVSGEIWMFCLVEGCHSPWFQNFYEDHKIKFHGANSPPDAECGAFQDLSLFELVSEKPEDANNGDKEVLIEWDQSQNNAYYEERKTASDEKVGLDKAEPRSVRVSSHGRRQEEERVDSSATMPAGHNKDEVNLSSLLMSGNNGDRRNGDQSGIGDVESVVGRRWIQKLVMVHPTGTMTDARKSELELSGMPQCRGGHILKRMDITHNYGVPSDMHMFWEESQAGEAGNVSTVSVALIGNANPPDLSEYADTVRRIVFFGHICRIKTALQMVMQLKLCEKVEFHLGSREQSDYYLEDDLLPANPESCWSIFAETQPLIKAVSIRSNVSQYDDEPEKAAIKTIVRKQMKDILRFGHILWPNVNKMTVDLPGEGIYLDIVKQYLPFWSKVHEAFRVELKDSKICLGRKGLPSPPTATTAEEELDNMNGQREDLKFGKDKDDHLQHAHIYHSVVNQRSPRATINDSINDTILQQNVRVNAFVPPVELLSDINFGVKSSYSPQLLDESTLYRTQFYQTHSPSTAQYSRDDLSTGAVVEDKPIAVVKSDEGFQVSVGLGLEDLRPHIQNKEKVADSQSQSPYSGYIYDATSDSYRRPPPATFSETQRSGTTVSDHSRVHYEHDFSTQVPFTEASVYPFDLRSSYLPTRTPDPSLQPIPNSVNPPPTYNWSFFAGNYTQPNCYDSQSSETQEKKMFAQNSYRSNEAAGVEGVPCSPYKYGEYGDTMSPSMSSNQAEFNPAKRRRASSPWSSSSEGGELMDVDMHNMSLSSRPQNSSCHKKFQKKPDRRSGVWKRKSSVNSSIVIMGVPENYSDFELSMIMKQILPSWRGRPRKERIGLAVGAGNRPRPLKVVLRNSEEAEEAIRNAQGRPVKLKNGPNFSVKKYIPKLDRNSTNSREYSHKLPSQKSSTFRSHNELGNQYRSVSHPRDRHDSSSDQDMPPYNPQDQ